MAPADAATLESRLAEYAGQQLGHPCTVLGLQRIAGGASRETYRFKLVQRDANAPPRALILRIDPAVSLIDTTRRVEFEAIRAFHGSDVPVPEALWIEDDDAALGAPFMVMTEITGGEAGGPKLMVAPYTEHRESIGRQKWAILGRIAAADPVALGLTSVLAAVCAEDCWRRELDHWATVLDENALEPQPIQQAAIRWMRRHPPAPAQRVGVVHGDYRTGNFLVTPDARVIGILDWEMVHLGDPLEDLGWSLNRVWCFARNDLRGGWLHRDAAIATWERASGLTADPDALRWWELLNCLKGQAIWLTAARRVQQGESRDAMMTVASWTTINSQDRATLELMGRLNQRGARGLPEGRSS